MEQDTTFQSPIMPKNSIKWCHYLVNVGYMTAALMILAHLIWYFAARSVLARPPQVYLQDYIILPTLIFFPFNGMIDLLVRSSRVSLFWKEYLALSLFVIYSGYLALTHDLAKVLLASFILPIFVSTIFSNQKITRLIFWMSNLTLLLLGIRNFLASTLDSLMMMQIFVACFMFLCSFLLARVLIQNGNENLAALLDYSSRQRLMQEQLQLDLFTDLKNRKTFDQELARQMEVGRKANKMLALAMIDIDHFKDVNDQYGHAVGDLVLLFFANLLKALQAENIQAFRIGGEEFAILMLDCNEPEAYHICEGLRLRMESAALSEIEQKKITISCGLICKKLNQIDPETLTKAADTALYEAKHRGRNQVVLSSAL